MQKSVKKTSRRGIHPRCQKAVKTPDERNKKVRQFERPSKLSHFCRTTAKYPNPAAKIQQIIDIHKDMTKKKSKNMYFPLFGGAAEK